MTLLFEQGVGMGGGRLASKKVGMGGAVIAGLSHLRTDGVSEQHCSCCNF